MKDHLTLFLHFRWDALAESHHRRLVAHEGAGNVVVLDVSGNPGAIDLGKYAGEDRWKGPDAAVYRWARSADFVPARRYFIVEYDACVNMPLKEWAGDRYDADLAATSVGGPISHPDWTWWQDLCYLPAAIREHVACLCPFGVHLISGRCLRAVAELDPVPGVFCELRLASYAKTAGFALTPFRPDAPGKVWIEPLPPTEAPGVWHSIKTANPGVPPRWGP